MNRGVKRGMNEPKTDEKLMQFELVFLKQFPFFSAMVANATHANHTIHHSLLLSTN